jgi:hypothetical protein
LRDGGGGRAGGGLRIGGGPGAGGGARAATCAGGREEVRLGAAATLLGGCLALAAASLLLPWALAFDPQAWVVWGRELWRGTLDTAAGPSWKPLPVLVTAPAQVLGEAAPLAWLIVARAGALLALAGAARVACRLAGPVAAVGTAGVLALGPWWLYNAALGNSEGLLVAAMLWAVAAHLAGRPGAALALAVVAGLLRPEMWPFAFAYAAWAWRAGSLPAGRVLLALLPLPLLWLGPDLLGSGGAVAASHAALGPGAEGSARDAAVPALAVAWDAAALLTAPGAVAAAVAVAAGRGAERALALLALAWVGLVAVETELGYAGNPRYLVPAAGLGAVLAGVGVARLGAAAWGPRLPPAPLACAALLAAMLALGLGDLRAQLAEVGRRAAARRGLDALVAQAGGAEAVRACAPVRTSDAMRSLVAWRLDLPMYDLDAPQGPEGTLLRARAARGGPLEPAPLRAYARAGAAPGWERWATCP